MTTFTAKTATWRQLTATIIGAGTIAVGLLSMGTAIANAEPKPQTPAQTECGSEDPGDVYTSSTSGGHTTEKCCYEGLLLGVQHCDVWVDGKYRGDLSYKELPATPTTPTKPVVTGPAQNPNGSVSSDEQNPKPPTTGPGGPINPRPLPAQVKK